MDIIRLHERALDEAARLVDGVRPDQMGLPTPCSDWGVRALITHLVAGNVRFLGVAEGTPRPERGPVCHATAVAGSVKAVAARPGPALRAHPRRPGRAIVA